MVVYIFKKITCKSLRKLWWLFCRQPILFKIFFNWSTNLAIGAKQCKMLFVLSKSFIVKWQKLLKLPPKKGLWNSFPHILWKKCIHTYWLTQILIFVIVYGLIYNSFYSNFNSIIKPFLFYLIYHDIYLSYIQNYHIGLSWQQKKSSAHS